MRIEWIAQTGCQYCIESRDDEIAGAKILAAVGAKKRKLGLARMVEWRTAAFCKMESVRERNSGVSPRQCGVYDSFDDTWRSQLLPFPQ
jgi:hypothetical protein